MRRAGRMPTGVDRVEHAYLTQFLADDVACFGLVRTTFGYLLLDRQGLQGVLDRVEGRTDWGDCHRPRIISFETGGRASYGVGA